MYKYNKLEMSFVELEMTVPYMRKLRWNLDGLIDG